MLAAPWWLTTISRHGFGIFTRTAGSRLGIGQGLVWFPTNFAYLPETRFLALWHVLVLLGVLALLARRRYLLVGWSATMALVYPEPRFLLFVGAFPASAFVFDVFVPALVGRIVDERDRSAARTRTDAGSAGTGGSQARDRAIRYRPRSPRRPRGALRARALWHQNGGAIRRELRADPRPPARPIARGPPPRARRSCRPPGNGLDAPEHTSGSGLRSDRRRRGVVPIPRRTDVARLAVGGPDGSHRRHAKPRPNGIARPPSVAPRRVSPERSTALPTRRRTPDRARRICTSRGSARAVGPPATRFREPSGANWRAHTSAPTATRSSIGTVAS